MVAEESDKIEQVRGIKGPVPEIEQLFEIVIRMLQDELVRRLVHQLHQLLRFPDDGLPVPPGKDSCKKTRDLDVLLPHIAMRYADRVVGDKRGRVVFGCFPLEERPQVFWWLLHNICREFAALRLPTSV